jgi:hypothetical protein
MGRRTLPSGPFPRPPGGKPRRLEKTLHYQENAYHRFDPVHAIVETLTAARWSVISD